jgi:hypothetical protein
MAVTNRIEVDPRVMLGKPVIQAALACAAVSPPEVPPGR